MKKLLILPILVMCTMTSVSQKLTDEEINELKPYHYQTKLLVNLIPVNIGLGAKSFTSGYGANVDGFVGKFVSFSGGFSKAGYVDGNGPRGNDNGFAGASDSFQGIKTAGETFANLNFHLLDKMAIGKIRMEKYKGTTTTMSGTKYDVYDLYKKRGPVRKIIAVRGGIYSWQNGVVPETSDQWLMLKTGTTTPTVAATERTFTTLYSTNFSVGIGSEKFVANSDMGGGLDLDRAAWPLRDAGPKGTACVMWRSEAVATMKANWEHPSPRMNPARPAPARRLPPTRHP